MTFTSVLESILRHAQTQPEQPAAKDLEQDLSYSELLHEAGRFAAGLVAQGVGPGDRVALHLSNSVDFVVTSLASLWIGATFVPLAVSDPESRSAMILDDCAPAVVVTSAAPGQAEDYPPRLGRLSVITVSELRAVQAGPPPRANTEHAAYAIYTSGTTGSPKGVLIGQQAFAAAVAATSAALELDGRTRTLCVSPFHFDGSFGTLFPTLYSGGAVVIRPREALLFPRTFFKAVLQERVTYTGFSPSYLRLLLASPQITKLVGSTLETVALGGEASSIADVRALWAAVPQLRVFNRYGPTEATIAVTHVELRPELTQDGVIPLGQPHRDVTFYLLDEGRILDGTNRVGELYIGGVQLMDGYWRATALTSEVLRNDVVAGQIVYRTGDLMYRNERGDYVYVDRADRVIKRNGVRISLVELGEALRRIAGVRAAACVVYDDDEQLAIAGFVVTDEPMSAVELHRSARELLPASMIPDRINVVAALPLTASSKLDEHLLLAEAGLRERSPASAPGSGAEPVPLGQRPSSQGSAGP